MQTIQLIGHRPSLKNHQTGERKLFKDFKDLVDFLNKTNIEVEGAGNLPLFYRDMLKYRPVSSDHIIQLTEGGIS